MCECSTLCPANIGVLARLTSQKTQRTVGNWRALRSWRRSCLPPPHPPASLLGSSRGGTDLSRSWRRDVVFPPRSSGRHRRSFCCFTMDLWTKRAAGIVVLVALLLSRMTAEGEHSFPAFSLFYFSSPGGDGGSPGCADPEGIAPTGALWMTRNPRFCCFQVDIWTVSDSVLLKLDNCCLVHEYFKIWKFSLNKKTRIEVVNCTESIFNLNHV